MTDTTEPNPEGMKVAEAVREACRNEADKRAMNWLVAREISAAIRALDLSTLTDTPPHGQDDTALSGAV